jgi:putative ABC transport system substrate-binding protein
LGSAEAQQARLPPIGYLTFRSSPSEQDQLFKQALAELGWVDGQNCIVEWRGSSGSLQNVSAAAAELVRLKVDVIVASSTPVIQGTKNTTTSIPIVMSGAADPVGIGFVASLARPGGNITGLSLQSPELAGKRLQLLKDIAPKLSRVAFLAYRPDPAHRLFVKEATDAAAVMNIQVQPLVVENTDDIDIRIFSITSRASRCTYRSAAFHWWTSAGQDNCRVRDKEPFADRFGRHSVRRCRRFDLLRAESLRTS